MRKSFAVLILAVGVLVGYALHTVSVEAQVPQSEWFAFNVGESVTLLADLPQSQISCKVTRVENGFIGCARDDQRQSAQWINLRFVKTITPRER